MNRLPWLLCLTALIACDDDDTPTGPYARGSLDRAATFPGTPQDEGTYAAGFAPLPYGPQACDAPRGDLELRREIRIFHHPSQAARVLRVTQGLASYYQRYGLEFFTRHPPIPIPINWLFDFDEVRLTRHLRAEFPHLDFSAPEFPGSDLELELVYAEAFYFTFAPIVDFVAAYGDQGEDITHLILLPQFIVENERFPPRPGEPGVLGLALSPTLLTRFRSGGDPAEAQFWHHFPVQGSFTPMMFINTGLLDKLVDRGISDVTIDLVAAHEFGHTVGLEHTEASLNNLMYPGLGDTSQFDCDAELTEDQLATAEMTLNGDQRAQALTPPISKVDKWSRLRDHLSGGPSPFQLPL